MKSTFSELPEHDARQTQGGLHPDVQAAYDYVSRVASTADIPHPFPAWHGWALREAFLAGCSRHSGTTPPTPISVQEQLPTVEDCDESGWCWFYTPGFLGVGDWTKQKLRTLDHYIFYNLTHWLPANAIPSPPSP